MKKLDKANVMFSIISNYIFTHKIVSVYTIFNLETMHIELLASGIYGKPKRSFYLRNNIRKSNRNSPCNMTNREIM